MNSEIDELFDGPKVDDEITKDIDADCVGWIVLPCFKVKVKDDGEISLVCAISQAGYSSTYSSICGLAKFIYIERVKRYGND